MMQVKYVDVHCHVQFDAYSTDTDELIENMRQEGVAGIVVGVDRDSSEKAVALAKKHEHLYASVGLHPNREPDEWFDTTVYRELAANQKVVAVGECGLDFFRPAEVNDEVKRKQKRILKEQVELAVELDKPLIIHARPSKGTYDAYHDLIQILKEAKQKYGKKLRGDIHFFVGGVAEAKTLTALGFCLSFTAVITFARDYDEVIRTIPLDRILAETDAPYVAPASRRGERNDPLAVIEVVREIARVRGEDPETVRGALVANAERLFTLKH